MLLLQLSVSPQQKQRVPVRFSGYGVSLGKLGIRDFKEKSGRDSGFNQSVKVYARSGMPKIILRITGLHEVLGRDYGIDEVSNNMKTIEVLSITLIYYSSCIFTKVLVLSFGMTGDARKHITLYNCTSIIRQTLLSIRHKACEICI